MLFKTLQAVVACSTSGLGQRAVMTYSALCRVALLLLQFGAAARCVGRRAALASAPTLATGCSAAAVGATAPTKLVRYGSDDDQVAELYQLQPGDGAPRPVVALLHGGYWRQSYGRELMDAVARDVAARGEFHCLNVE